MVYVFGFIAWLLLLAVAVLTIGGVFLLSRETKKALALLSCMKVRQDLEELSSVRRDLRTAVENQDFESAKNLKALIDKLTEVINEEVSNINERYGGTVDFSVTEVIRLRDEED